MPTLQEKVTELEGRVATLKAAVDASQAREAQQDAFDKETIATLTTQRDALQAVIDNGQLTPEQEASLQSVIDGIDAAVTDINTPFPPA